MLTPEQLRYRREENPVEYGILTKILQKGTIKSKGLLKSPKTSSIFTPKKRLGDLTFGNQLTTRKHPIAGFRGSTLRKSYTPFGSFKQRANDYLR